MLLFVVVEAASVLKAIKACFRAETRVLVTTNKRIRALKAFSDLMLRLSFILDCYYIYCTLR